MTMRRTNRDPDRRTWTLEENTLREDTTPKYGKPYTHRCWLENFRMLVYWIDERNGEPFTTTIAWDELVSEISNTQVSVALAFLVERGILVRCYPRMLEPASAGGTHLDAMTELYALDKTRTTR